MQKRIIVSHGTNNNYQLLLDIIHVKGGDFLHHKSDIMINSLTHFEVSLCYLEIESYIIFYYCCKFGR